MKKTIKTKKLKKKKHKKKRFFFFKPLVFGFFKKTNNPAE